MSYGIAYWSSFAIIRPITGNRTIGLFSTHFPALLHRNPNLFLQYFLRRYDKHMAFHQKFREKFLSDDSSAQTQLPVFFGNVCLRFLPVLDIIIHRFLEVPIISVNKTLESILDHLGCLYKFHGMLSDQRLIHSTTNQLNCISFPTRRSSNQLFIQYVAFLRT